ncbi:MAG TPA: polyprenyl synthetase family protein [Desulfotomaculum sp.]|nr:polyprenyl synthetase family protein [Desulfotomaculum sp.]
MDFNAVLAEKARIIDQALDRYLPHETTPPGIIHQAIRYSALSGGKRLRPALVLGAAEAVGGSAENVITAACGIELIHCYSLVHDDLPAMDNDDLRRGKPTSHKVFGEAVAILAGDALLTLGFELLARAGTSAAVSPADGLRVIAEVAVAAGTEGMVGGQVMDIKSQEAGGSPELVAEIHQKKTAALFVASVRTGAILSGASGQQLAALSRYGKRLGLAFQITDDILDIAGDPSKTGKSTGGDARKRKLTYPGIFGLSAAREYAKKAVEDAVGALDSFGPSADFLRAAAQFILTRQF